MKPTSRKNILLDLGGVLVGVDHESAVAEFSKKTGRSKDTVRRVFRSSNLYFDFNSGLIDAKQFRRQVLAELSSVLSDRDFDAAWSATITALSHIGPLLKLTAENHDLYLLSNTDPIHFSWVEVHTNWLKYFKGLHLSFQVGLCKPHPRYYTAALERFELRPENCIFFDDLRANIEGAQKIGIRGHQVNGLGLQPEDLSRCNIPL